MANDIRSNVPSKDLVDRFYPGVPFRKDIGTYGSLIANDGAREALGFEPSLSWRDEVPQDDLATALPEA